MQRPRPLALGRRPSEQGGPGKVEAALALVLRGARLELASESVVPDEALVVSYLGYPGPGGGVHFDYTMADAIVLPPDHAKYGDRAEDAPVALRGPSRGYQTPQKSS